MSNDPYHKATVSYRINNFSPPKVKREKGKYVNSLWKFRQYIDSFLDEFSVFFCLFIYMYVCVSLCMFVCMYVYVYSIYVLVSDLTN